MQEIRLWTIGEDNQGNLSAEPVDTTDHTETEKQLEDLLVLSNFLCKIFLSQFFEERQVLTHFSYRV